MPLSYCEICGVLIKSQHGQEAPEGVICDGCFDSRQVVLGTSSEEAFDPITIAADEPVQFECIYCRSLLRLPVPAARTSVRCPQCQETFFLLPNGGVEARLQGNTTAIIAKDQSLRSLTPPTGDERAATQQLPAQGNKTQPINPVSDSQKLALRDLASRNLDVVRSLPARELLPVDMKRREREIAARQSDPVLELLPEDVGPGEATVTHERSPLELKPSDEGQIDMGIEKLKERSTRKLGKTGPAGKKIKKLKDKKERKETPEERKKRTERRERRKAKAAEKTQELAKSQTRSSLRTSLLWGSAILPLLMCLLLISMTLRGSGFAMRGEVGAKLRDFGHQIDLGLRRLNEQLPTTTRNPDLTKNRR